MRLGQDLSSFVEALEQAPDRMKAGPLTPLLVALDLVAQCAHPRPTHRHMDMLVSDSNDPEKRWQARVLCALCGAHRALSDETWQRPAALASVTRERVATFDATLEARARLAEGLAQVSAALREIGEGVTASAAAGATVDDCRAFENATNALRACVERLRQSELFTLRFQT